MIHKLIMFTINLCRTDGKRDLSFRSRSTTACVISYMYNYSSGLLSTEKVSSYYATITIV